MFLFDPSLSSFSLSFLLLSSCGELLLGSGEEDEDGGSLSSWDFFGRGLPKKLSDGLSFSFLASGEDVPSVLRCSDWLSPFDLSSSAGVAYNRVCAHRGIRVVGDGTGRTRRVRRWAVLVWSVRRMNIRIEVGNDELVK